MATVAKEHRAPPRQRAFRFQKRRLLQIAMPLGGIGAGCIHLTGWGGFGDFSIRNRPFFSSARPDHWTPPDGPRFLESAFGLLHLPETKITRLLEGPLPPELIYNQGLNSQGYRHGGHEGLPRFAQAVFEGDFPFGHVGMSDPKIPLGVGLTAFSPFVPRDDRASGMPCAIVEYSLRNPTRKPVRYELSFHLPHLAVGESEGERGTRNKVIAGRGILFSNTEPAESETFATACLMALTGRPVIKGMWFRGPAGFFDSISALWSEVSAGQFKPNMGSNGIDVDGRNGGSILFRGRLGPGQSAVHPLVISWHFPNSYQRHGFPNDAPPPPAGPAWRPWYAGVWTNAQAVADEVRKRYVPLRRRTRAFTDALFGSSLPRSALDAISCNLAILKSPTVLRQENGNVWGWEGCFTNEGCCPGSCTHVWNYAQSLCHLFPQLERTLREQEWRRSMDDRGHVTFRAALPDGAPGHSSHAAADGQLGGPMKLYRDWRISGDTAWMRSLYPLARRSLEYAINTWDPRRQGVLSEPHHNTYDIEFWGPNSMCSTIYIGALSAMAQLAEACGQDHDRATYAELARKGAAFLDAELFNGEYYFQRVEYQQLVDQSFAQNIAKVGPRSGEVHLLLASEGPKYQYGAGCLSDAVIGAWMASLYGVNTPMNAKHIRSTLAAIVRHNFRRDFREHACTQRPGYAMGRAGGLVLCSWPRGGRPTLPFPYSDELFTGVEYQVAAHLIREGLVRQGMQIVRAVRSRHNGQVRNPWNEYECGGYYARAMASYALLSALTGFRYDAVECTLHFGPKSKARPFSSFFSTQSAHGTILLDQRSLTVSVLEGSLDIDRVLLDLDRKPVQIKGKKTARPGRPARYLLKNFLIE